MSVKGEGKAYKWILAHQDYPHKDWCLIWPFSRDKHGRGNLVRVHGEELLGASFHVPPGEG